MEQVELGGTAMVLRPPSVATTEEVLGSPPRLSEGGDGGGEGGGSMCHDEWVEEDGKACSLTVLDEQEYQVPSRIASIRAWALACSLC
jgi:hypothetical protein